MSSYNISVMKPEDEETYYNNALQLQPASLNFGHHSAPSSFQDGYITTSYRNGYTYPYDSTSGLVNNLTNLTTERNSLSPRMQSNQPVDPDAGRIGHGRNSAGFSYAAPSMFRDSPNLHFIDPNLPSNVMSGSPLSQGYSPLTPNTPLSTVGTSPTRSSLPSPGSQGSSGVLRLAPSPVSSSSSTIGNDSFNQSFNQLQLNNSYFSHQYVSDTQLYIPQPLPRAEQGVQHYPNAFPDSSSQSGVTVRRHSHSAEERPRHMSRFSPYPSPSALCERNLTLHSTTFDEVPRIYPLEYTFMGWQLPGPVVPQTAYQPQTASDRRRYVDQIHLLPPIVFESTDPPGIGISLVDCTTQRFKKLKDADEEILVLFDDCGPSISIRLNWEGYEPWTRQIPTRNFKVPQGPVTRKHLAKNVAKSIQRFIDDHIGRPILADREPYWQVGPGRIEFNDLVLLSLHHVSKGSWQANVSLNRPLEQILNRSSVP